MRANLMQGDALHIPLADGVVQCVVTSPPYYGLRDYGTAEWEGGDAECDHNPQRPDGGERADRSLPLGRGGMYKDICGKCGAIRKDAQLGLEPTLAEYIENMVAVFAEVWRVLRDDGVVWLNMGDSYTSGGRSTRDPGQSKLHPAQPKGMTRPSDPEGMKPKDLMMVPHRLAIALQEWGWWVRSDIVWHKPNPMPESVTDRPTKSHEYIFLLSKNARYYYDQDAVREVANYDGRHDEIMKGSEKYANGFVPNQSPQSIALRGHERWKHRLPDGTRARNRRSVWTITTKPYSGAHFACVDEETECLTKDGWKKYNQLNPGMIIAGLDLQSRDLNWQILKDVSVYDVVDQDMVSVETRDLSMLLTPNHRTVIRKRTKRKLITDNYKVVRADELNTRSYIPLAGEWFREFGNIYIQPEVAELMGWFVTDGYIKHDKFVAIDQSWAVNKHKCNRIRYLLEYLEADYKWNISERTWNDRPADMMQIRIQGEIAERILALCPNKRVPFGVLNWDVRSQKAFLDGVIGGDGSTRKDGRIAIIQKRKEFLDDIQAIAVRLGYTANLSQRKDETWMLYLTDRKYRGLRGTNGTGFVGTITRYTGKVWCPQTPMTTFIARRNGKVFITGNTFPPEIPEVCIKAGTSEKGQCPECGAPWVRVVEKELTGELLVDGSIKKTKASRRYEANGSEYNSDTSVFKTGMWNKSTTTGWRPTCSHEPEPVPQIVLDPFNGSGTTVAVAQALGRIGVGQDISWEYLQLARERTGLSALDEWQNGRKAEANLEGLPMFGG